MLWTTPPPASICRYSSSWRACAAKFVKCAERFDAEIQVTREGQTVPGTSILGLMMLATGQGNAIVIAAKGADAQDVPIALVDAGFNEQG